MKEADQLHIYGFDTFLNDHNVHSRYPFYNLFKEYDKEARALWSQLVNQQREGRHSLAYIVARVYGYKSTEKAAFNALQAYDD